MEILGVDIGYTYTKTNKGVLFPSKIMEVDDISDGEKIKIDGKTYIIGFGNSALDVNKINSEVTKVCLFAAIAKSTKNDEVNIVTGLPIGQFKAKGQEFKKMILDNAEKEIEFNGEKRTIKINDVKIYAQGAGALYNQQVDDEVIIVDIGGRTIDIAYFEIEGNRRGLSTHSTLFSGMLKLYTSVIEAVNTKFDLALNASDAEKILTKGLTIDGEKQDDSFLKPIKMAHFDELKQELELKYPYKTVPILFCGGGYEAVSSELNNMFANTSKIKNAQFANANGFAKVGEKVWQHQE